MKVTVRVPATTANLGPGFDCLGLALDLWNEADFTLQGKGWQVSVAGEGAAWLPRDERNLVAQALQAFYRAHALPFPGGVRIACRNRIPTGSGLGSSAAACLLGLLAANLLSGANATPAELLSLAAEIEGHADNAAAALHGGLVALTPDKSGWIVQRYEIPPLPVVIVLPDVHLETRRARAALPDRVPFADAVHNLGRVPLVIHALQTGDLDLLRRVMDDRLHQPHRLPLIPGAAQALTAAREAGAAAALSGAGPSLIAFPPAEPGVITAAMQTAFARADVASSFFLLTVTSQAAQARPG